MESFFPLIIVGVIVLVVVLIIVNILQERRRREALTRLAQQHGLRFDRNRDRSFDERFPHFDCLKEGSDRYAYNILTGEYRGRPLLAFDYHYETYSTDAKGRRQTHHHYFSAVIVTSDVPLKPLFIREEHFFDRIGEFFGLDDIDFESAEFSRAFCVKSPDRRWAYDVLHPRAMQFLLDGPRYNMAFDHRHVIAWRSRRFEPRQFLTAADHVHGLLDMLPEYLVQQQTGRAAG